MPRSALDLDVRLVGERYDADRVALDLDLAVLLHLPQRLHDLGIRQDIVHGPETVAPDEGVRENGHQPRSNLIGHVLPPPVELEAAPHAGEDVAPAGLRVA